MSKYVYHCTICDEYDFSKSAMYEHMRKHLNIYKAEPKSGKLTLVEIERRSE